MLFCAILGIVATVPRPAKAEVTQMEGLEELPDFTGYTEKELEVGDIVTGCWLKLEVPGVKPEDGVSAFQGAINFNETALFYIFIEGWQSYYDSVFGAYTTERDLFSRYYEEGAETDCYYIYIDEDVYIAGDGLPEGAVEEVFGSKHKSSKGFTVKSIENFEIYAGGEVHKAKISRLTAPVSDKNPGSSLTEKTDKTIDDFTTLEIVGLVAMAAIELLGAAIYIMKAPNGKYKWLILACFVLISVIFDMAAYANFAGII